jgi:hypothetical protein
MLDTGALREVPGENNTVSKFASYLNRVGGFSTSPPHSGWKTALEQTGEKSANTASPTKVVVL